MEKDKFLELNKDNDKLHSFKVYYDPHCVICHSTFSSTYIGNVCEHEYSGTTSLIFPVYQCNNCQLTYLYPRPDTSELNTIYPSDYYSYNFSTNKPENERNQKSFVKSIWWWINLQTWRSRVMPFIHPLQGQPIKILDIGCGIGAQLDNLKRLFPQSETHGVDINETALEKARRSGHKVHHGRFEDVNLPQSYFDIVYSIHVIEHVARPDTFIQKCLDLLSSNGILLIETPNTDSLDYRMLKKKHWGGYHAPRHWYLFNVETFRHLCKRLNVKIVSFAPYNIAVFWNWSCHSICKSLMGKKIADKLFPPVNIFYGGLQSFIILSFFSILGRVLLRIFKKGNAMWIILKKD